MMAVASVSPDRSPGNVTLVSIGASSNLCAPKLAARGAGPFAHAAVTCFNFGRTWQMCGHWGPHRGRLMNRTLLGIAAVAAATGLCAACSGSNRGRAADSGSGSDSTLLDGPGDQRLGEASSD